MLAFLGTLGTPEILIIALLILLLFGARKLPEMARGMGQAIKEFKRGANEIVSEIENADRDIKTATSVSNAPKAKSVERETAEEPVHAES